jgi:predicted CDP-diglyceride synthetase/phosphatidate cytidylyltransferase
VRFVSFLSGGFITAIVVNSPERKLAKRTSVQCIADIFPPPLKLTKQTVRILCYWAVIPISVTRGCPLVKNISLYKLISILFFNFYIDLSLILQEHDVLQYQNSCVINCNYYSQ